MNQCSIQGCDRPLGIIKVQLCMYHYQRKRKNTIMVYGKKKLCSIEMCNEPHHGKTLCRKHYDHYLINKLHTKSRVLKPRRRTREYRSYYSMRNRCTNKNDPEYHRYGGRGITICDTWMQSFDNFLNDMGERPQGTTLDRINNDGNYEPSNCRWASWHEQAANRSTTSESMGVRPYGRRWRAMLMVNRVYVLDKRFGSFEEALAARKEAELKYLP